jgi:hypothetical protein
MTFDYFADETFHVPRSGGGKTFYVFAVVGIRQQDLATITAEMQNRFLGKRWHSIEILSRRNGIKKFQDFVSHFGPHLKLHVFQISPIDQLDSTGELSRRKLMTEIVDRFCGGDLKSFVIFEKRSGGHLQLDRETLFDLHLSGYEKVRMKSPEDARLLWLADALAYAYRKCLLNGDATLLECFRNSVSIHKFFRC